VRAALPDDVPGIENPVVEDQPCGRKIPVSAKRGGQRNGSENEPWTAQGTETHKVFGLCAVPQLSCSGPQGGLAFSGALQMPNVHV
jgi:hypothetical protein